MAAKVQGVDRLTKKLRELPDAMQNEIFGGFEKGAEEMVGMSRRLAPVDDGALRDSIGWRWDDSRSADRTLEISAGDAKAFYARWVEFGTAIRSPLPFFFPAWRALRKKITSRNKRAMSKVARKVAAGGN